MRNLRTVSSVLVSLMLLNAPVVRAQDTSVQAVAVEPTAPPLSKEELEAVLAPVALYSDTLLAQVFMASTYPLEVVEAERWANAHASLKGEALLSALDKERWDASVKALVQVPTVLKMMSDKLDWTQKLGDAFLAQQSDVMTAVQRLRHRADSAGNLKTIKEQRVVHQQETIVIEQAAPEVIYVPAYNPIVVYGTWPYPAYQPYYWPSYYGYSPVGAAFAWGVGAAITAGVWNNAFDWGHGSINIHNNININNRWRNNTWTDNNRNWSHDASHRRGVNYRDQASRDRFAKGDRGNIANRQNYRGRDTNRGNTQIGNRDLTGGRTGRDTASRSGRSDAAYNQRGDNSLNRGGQSSRGRQNSFGDGRSSGYDGIGNGARTRDYSNRGASSRGSVGRGYSGGERGYGGGHRGGGRGGRGR